MRTWILLAAVVLAAAFILTRPDAGIRLSDISPERISSIRMERPGMQAIRLEREGRAWKIASPVKAEAKSDAVKSILSILEAKSEQRLVAVDLSRFGLDKPVLKLYLDSEEYDFGMINSLTGQQYVKKGGGVYLISAKYAQIPSLSELEGHAGAS